MRRGTHLRPGRVPPADQPLDAVHITDVLDRLSQPHRQVLTLRAYGLNEEEMAEVLALPVGTVRSRLFRARRRFQEAWQPSAA
ncbi:sigma factor-like helix-turn-helix DNA-binding protein [Streptomyces sp. G1]|uniref:sigma factor-like helix-turn-helix DNA-binding protein n=1 Tax=Streptomyces sp. G1 TaxID=361572 RepID=UPI0035AB7266